MLDVWRATSWRPVVTNAVSRILPSEVLLALKDHPADSMYGDEMEYLDGALERFRSESFHETRARLTSAVLDEFQTIRAFHGCKPVSLESYLRDGIKPLTREWLTQEALELHAETHSQEKIVTSVAEADLGGRLGQIYFYTHTDGLIEHGSRYMVYGAESMCCVGSAGQFYDTCDRQRARGIATILECAVPLSFLSESWRGEVASDLITRYFQEQSEKPLTESYERDSCIGIEVGLPATNILGHFHPAILTDIHHPFEPFINSATICPYC